MHKAVTLLSSDKNVENTNLCMTPLQYCSTVITTVAHGCDVCAVRWGLHADILKHHAFKLNGETPSGLVIYGESFVT